MFFLNPFYLYLLPLGLLPILWHLLASRKRRQVTVPSNFFLEKLYRKQRRNMITSNWLELLLEVLFIILLVLLFAHPSSTSLSARADNIYIFIDNTRGLADRDQAELPLSSVRSDLAELWDSRDSETRIFLFNVEMLKDDELPIEMLSLDDINDFIVRTVIYNGPFQFAELDDYLERHASIFQTADNMFLVISSWQERQFASKFLNERQRLYIHVPETEENYDVISDYSLANKIYFVNEKIPFHVDLVHHGRKARKKVSLSVGDRDRYVKELELGPDKAVRIETELIFERPGFQDIVLKLEEKGRTREFFLGLYISPSLRLRIHPSHNTPSRRMLLRLLDYDIKNRNIIIDQNRYDLSIVLGFEHTSELSFFSRGGGIMFLPAGMDIKKLNDFLSHKLQTDIFLHKEVTGLERGASLNIREDQVLSGPFAIFNRNDNLSSVYVNRVYRAAWGEMRPGSETAMFLRDEIPFLMRQGRLVIFPFDPAAENSNFFFSPFAVPLVLQTLLLLKRDKDVIYTHTENGDAAVESVPLRQDLENRYFLPPGLYSNGDMYTVLNNTPDTLTSPRSDKGSTYFKRASFISTVDIFTAGVGGFSFDLRKLFSLLDILVLLALGYIFLLKKRQS